MNQNEDRMMMLTNNAKLNIKKYIEDIFLFIPASVFMGFTLKL